MKKTDSDQWIKMESEAALEAEELRLQREAEAEAAKVREANLQEQEENKRLAPYLGGLPYDRNRVVQEIRFYLNRSCQDMIEAGKRLIAIKEKEGWGNWIKVVENEIGVSRWTASRFMAIGKKFEMVHGVHHLTVTFEKGVGKLYALLDVPDEELQEFEKTGELRGMTVDEIDRMSVKDLRDKLRRRDKQIDQGKLQLQEVEAKIKDLEEHLAKKEPLFSSDEERDMAFLQEAQLTFVRSIVQLQRVDVVKVSPKIRFEVWTLSQYFAKLAVEVTDRIEAEFPDIAEPVMADMLDTGRWDTEERHPLGPKSLEALKKLQAKKDGSGSEETGS
ncbi:MAG: DUF3102 domain-containing protein [Nitrospirae bacterium]|nr:DUF3102 domain-containing protein [Nitrospirota bacterium]